MADLLFRFVVLITSAALWLAGLRLFLRADLSPRHKRFWSLGLAGAGVVIGLLLGGAALWNKYLLLLAMLPALAAADVLLLRSQRGWSFWLRACGFEVGTVFGVAGIARLLCDLAGVRALVAPG